MPLVKFDRESRSYRYNVGNLFIVIDDQEIDVISNDEIKEVFITPGIRKVRLKGQGLMWFIKSEELELNVQEVYDTMLIIDVSSFTLWALGSILIIIILLIYFATYNSMVATVFSYILLLALLRLYYKKIGYKQIINFYEF
ncbi:MAG TPA: hypothetical protein PLW32_12095 [Chitinophagaceae bacterium]|jgi:hypothetical protein|nr:hypothetical protein [Chitinophagaceae bacterium]